MIKLTSLASLVLFATAVASSPLYAASSVLIWPIDPVINSHEKATALWLENKDSQPVYMQIRVLGWQQNPDRKITAINRRSSPAHQLPLFYQANVN